MGKVLTGKYDAAAQSLRLPEPLNGVSDDEIVRFSVIPPAANSRRPWLALQGSLSEEAADEMQHILDELFPPWNE